VGRTIGHFRVEAKLGQGGMGAVFRGFDTSLERPVALKVLLFDRPAARARFVREARAQAKVRHPNVVPIHYVGEDADIAFLAMDLVEGESLADRLRRSGALPVEEALRIATEVVKALAAGAAHHLVHRDIKPSNVLVDETGHVMLADFGLAKTLRHEELVAEDAAAGTAESAVLTHAGALVGTPAYMAPEQTRGPDVDHRADVYSLGATLYELLTGQPPFTADDARTLLVQHREEAPLPPRVLVPGLPPKVDALVLRMLEKDPAKRPTYDELPRALADALPKAPAKVGLFNRGAAAVIDLVVFAIPLGLVGQIHPALPWPIAVLALGLLEGRFDGSPGKKLLSMRTVGPHGDRMGIPRALARSLVKLWGPVLMGGYAALLGGTTLGNVLGGVTFLLWAAGLAIGFRRDKRTLHDRAAGTQVVYDV
jgi:serine/threonine-protein kinase